MANDASPVSRAACRRAASLRRVDEAETDRAFPEQVGLREMRRVQRDHHAPRWRRAGQCVSEDDVGLDGLASADRQVGDLHRQQRRSHIDRRARIAEQQNVAEIAVAQHLLLGAPYRVFGIEIGQRHRRHPDPHQGEAYGHDRRAGRQIGPPRVRACPRGEDGHQRPPLKTGSTGTRLSHRPTAGPARWRCRTPPPRAASVARPAAAADRQRSAPGPARMTA